MIFEQKILATTVDHTSTFALPQCFEQDFSCSIPRSKCRCLICCRCRTCISCFNLREVQVIKAIIFPFQLVKHPHNFKCYINNQTTKLLFERKGISVSLTPNIHNALQQWCCLPREDVESSQNHIAQ